MPTNVELYHYGIKGMRWGHRKARPQLSGAQRSDRRKRIAKRVALGLGAAAGAAALGYGAYRGHKALKTPSGAAKLMIGATRVDQGIDRAKGAARTAAGTVGGYALGGKHSSRRAGLAKAGAAAARAGGAIKKGAHNVKTDAQLYGYAAKTVAGVGAKRAGAAAQKVAGGYVLGGKRSKTRANLRAAGSAVRGAGSAVKKRAGNIASDASVIGSGVRYAGGVLGKRAVGKVKNTASDTRSKIRQGRAAAEVLADVYRSRRKYQGRHVARGAHAAHFAYDSPGEALYHFALDPYGRYAIL